MKVIHWISTVRLAVAFGQVRQPKDVGNGRLNARRLDFLDCGLYNGPDLWTLHQHRGPD
jgi:hypothetical protein